MWSPDKLKALQQYQQRSKELCLASRSSRFPPQKPKSDIARNKAFRFWYRELFLTQAGAKHYFNLDNVFRRAQRRRRARTRQCILRALNMPVVLVDIVIMYFAPLSDPGDFTVGWACWRESEDDVDCVMIQASVSRPEAASALLKYHNVVDAVLACVH